MVAVPAVLVAITFPLRLTIATVSLLLFQVTFLFVASLGSIVAVSCSLSPTSKTKVVLSKDMSITGTLVVPSSPPLGSPSQATKLAAKNKVLAKIRSLAGKLRFLEVLVRQGLHVCMYVCM